MKIKPAKKCGLNFLHKFVPMHTTKNLFFFKLSSFLLAYLFLFKVGFTQHKTLLKNIQYNILVCKKYNARTDSNFNIEKHCKKTAKTLALFLKSDSIPNKQIQSVGLNVGVVHKDKIKIYDFSYDCGGSRANITYPIIQWRDDSNHLCSFNFSDKINCSFNKIYTLAHKTKQLFLLLGTEKGDGACNQSIAYVIEIKNNKLIYDKAIFINRPFLNFCNIEFSFSEKKQLLIGKLYGGKQNLLNYIREQTPYSKNEKSNVDLNALLNNNYLKMGLIMLKFKGEKFTKL